MKRPSRSHSAARRHLARYDAIVGCCRLLFPFGISGSRAKLHPEGAFDYAMLLSCELLRDDLKRGWFRAEQAQERRPQRTQMEQTEQPDEIVFWDEPCPRCRSSLRYVKRSEPGKVFCDSCGYVEGEEQCATPCGLHEPPNASKRRSFAQRRRSGFRAGELPLGLPRSRPQRQILRAEAALRISAGDSRSACLRSRRQIASKCNEALSRDLWPLDPFESAPMRATSSGICNSILCAITETNENKGFSRDCSVEKRVGIPCP